MFEQNPEKCAVDDLLVDSVQGQIVPIALDNSSPAISFRAVTDLSISCSNVSLIATANRLISTTSASRAVSRLLRDVLEVVNQNRRHH